MRTLTKGLVAAAIGAAVLVPASAALADEPTPTPTAPYCTEEQREERLAERDQLRTEILAQLEQEGVTDPAEVAEQLRTRLHTALEEEFGPLAGPRAGFGAGPGGLAVGAGDGAGFRHGWSDS